MSITYESKPQQYRGTGTVFIARDEGRVWGYWDALPDAAPAPLEPLPQDLTLSEAAVWGLDRTPRVLVRAETSGYLAVGPDASRYVADDGVEGQLTVAALDSL